MNTSAAALFALRAFRSSSSPIKSNSNNTWTVRSLATTTNQKVASKPGSSTSGGGAPPKVEPKNIDPPANIFKQVDKSALGPGASKESEYKNPEYFSYHNMSFSEMELVMAKFRVPQPSCKK